LSGWPDSLWNTEVLISRLPVWNQSQLQPQPVTGQRPFSESGWSEQWTLTETFQEKKHRLLWEPAILDQASIQSCIPSPKVTWS